jgi:N-formylglutamate deformylase
LKPEFAAVADLRTGATPLIISLPHVGTELPSELTEQMTPTAWALTDTDWHVDRLYDFAREAGASWLRARISRYAIDLNRPPDDHSLYPGRTTSALCPTRSFTGDALYRYADPSPQEIGKRRERYWAPYHAMLHDLIQNTRARFGHAVLLDAHSIRSELPRLFPGRLPTINVGTNDGKSCEIALSDRLMSVLKQQTVFSHAINGRFKGGYIKRHYGLPALNVHAVQLELAQSAYMNETTTDYDPQLAQPLQSVLRRLIDELLRFRPIFMPTGSNPLT